MTPRRLVSLSAGTVLDAAPEAALAAAAAAGFTAFGVRWDPDVTPPAALPVLRRRIEGSGLVLLDLEVVRLGPGSAVAAHRPMVDVAAELGARFLLVVSHHADAARTVDELAQLADWCAPGTAVALEFMRFTAVPTYRAATALARAAGPGVGVIVDALHLHRGGETPGDLVAAGADEVAYVQLCDAPLLPPGRDDDLAALAEEARHRRLFPGDGELPLPALLGALPPGLPCCVEVQSDDWSARADVQARAELAMASLGPLLAAVPQP